MYRSWRPYSNIRHANMPKYRRPAHSTEKPNVLVSVVTTLYNYRDYIGELIDSVKAQTYQNWELVIIDDASTDNPAEVIEKYLSDSRIRYFRFEQNQGYSKAKNEGIVQSKGAFIVMIDADDLLTPNSIQDRVNMLMGNPQALWCHGDVYDLYPDGKTDVRASEKRKLLRAEMLRDGKHLDREYHHRLIHAQGIMVRRDFHKILGLYDESLRFSSDNEMFRRSIRFGVIPVFCPSFVAIYRHHLGQMSKSAEKQARLIKVKKVILAMVDRRFLEGINGHNTRLL